MEKTNKLSEYEERWFWKGLSDEKQMLNITLIFGSGLMIFAALICVLANAKFFAIVLPTIIAVLLSVPVALRFCHCYSNRKKYNALYAEYNKIDDQINMLKHCFGGWGAPPNTYHKLYRYLNSCNDDRYINGKIEKYYYIDELFFGKLKAYIILEKSIESATLDKESKQQLLQIKDILNKSAEDYYNKMINYQNSQAKTSVKVTLDVFKEVG